MMTVVLFRICVGENCSLITVNLFFTNAFSCKNGNCEVYLWERARFGYVWCTHSQAVYYGCGCIHAVVLKRRVTGLK